MNDDAPMTKAELDEAMTEIVGKLEGYIQRTIAEALQGPDLKDRSQDFKDGYAKGFYEGALLAKKANG